MKKIAFLLDLGYGNFPRISSFLNRIGYEVKIKNSMSKIGNSDLLIIPGIGNFNTVKNISNNLSLQNYIRDYKSHGNYIVGICLGMQLLCGANKESSLDDKGLEVFPFSVKKLNYNFKSKVPRIGWYESKSLINKSYSKKFYYSHSYYVHCKNNKYIKMITMHNNKTIPAIIQNNNIIGFQFHPELSGNNGIDIFNEMIR